MRLQSEIIIALILLIVGALATVIIYNIIYPNLNIINPSGQEISRSLKLNFQLLDYYIVNNTLYAYVKPSEPVNYYQVFAILNNRLVNVYPYNPNGSIVNPYNNGLLIIVANLSQIPPDQNGNYELEVGLENDIIGIFDIKYVSNTLINYFQPPCQLSYLPLIIYNAQSIPTPSPFQQDIAICNGNINIGPNFAYINDATLFMCINPNGQNIYFTTTNNSNPNIYSWYEGQLNYNGVTCDVWWINISQGINASSEITIYMYVGPNSANYYSQYYPYVGTNEQVIGTMQYDNGNYTFIAYGYFNNTFDGWNGYMSSSTAQTNYVPQATSYGIEMLNNQTWEGTYILPPNNWNIFEIPLIVEEAWYYGGGSPNADANVIALFGNTSQQIYAGSVGSTDGGSTPSSNLSTYVQSEYWPGNSPPNSQATMLKSAVTDQYLNQTSFPTSGGTFYSYLIVNSSYAQTGYYYYNSNQVWAPLTLLDTYNINNNEYTYSNLNYNPYQYPTLEISAGTGGTASYQYIQWVVARAYPPNGVMPSIYIG
ncbi:MAG: hypothetical protein RXQ68_02165 [Candidatus Nanopusillus sp.]